MNRTRTKRKQSASKARWRDLPDDILLVSSRTNDGIPRPQSLRPDHHVIEANALGDMAARLIVNAYKFHAPVVEVQQ